MTDKLWANIKHFSPDEFDDPTVPGSGLNMNISFIEILDKIREDCKFPLTINSGYRTEAHNVQVGGKPDSAHLRGVACDIAVPGSMDRFLVVSSALRNGIKRVGIGDVFIHLDMSYDLPQNVIWLYPFGVAG